MQDVIKAHRLATVDPAATGVELAKAATIGRQGVLIAVQDIGRTSDGILGPCGLENNNGIRGAASNTHPLAIVQDLATCSPARPSAGRQCHIRTTIGQRDGAGIVGGLKGHSAVALIPRPLTLTGDHRQSIVDGSLDQRIGLSADRITGLPTGIGFEFSVSRHALAYRVTHLLQSPRRAISRRIAVVWCG